MTDELYTRTYTGSDFCLFLLSLVVVTIFHLELIDKTRECGSYVFTVNEKKITYCTTTIFESQKGSLTKTCLVPIVLGLHIDLAFYAH